MCVAFGTLGKGTTTSTDIEQVIIDGPTFVQLLDGGEGFGKGGVRRICGAETARKTNTLKVIFV